MSAHTATMAQQALAGVQGSRDPVFEDRTPHIPAFQNYDPAMGMLG
jgi:hypothetical protein